MCPNCSGNQLSTKSRERPTAGTYGCAFLGFLFMFLDFMLGSVLDQVGQKLVRNQTYYHCEDCGHAWTA